MSRKLLAVQLGSLLLVSAIAHAGDITHGRALYLRYCASCHGVNGDGHGPVAPALRTPPADLRLLSARYGNPLPEDQIARFIDGRADVTAHGPREMPVWGEEVWQYRQGKGPKTQVTPRMADLVTYLQSIQTPQHRASITIGPNQAFPLDRHPTDRGEGKQIPSGTALVAEHEPAWKLGAPPGCIGPPETLWLQLSNNPGLSCGGRRASDPDFQAEAGQ